MPKPGSEAQVITWLHLSDLHWQDATSWRASRVLTPLLARLEERPEHLKKIDFIVISGDLAFGGQEADYRRVEEFLERLLKVTGVDRRHLLVVPGNHDVDQSTLERGMVSLSSPAAITDEDAIHKLLDDATARTSIMRRFRHYERFVQQFFRGGLRFDEKEYFTVKALKVGDQRIAVLLLNSAWSATAGDDEAKLFLGVPQVDGALARAGSADFRIAVMHHPLGWLKEFDRVECSVLLERGCQALLRGHLHATEVDLGLGPHGSRLTIAAGAGYDKEALFNSCNFVQLDLAARLCTVYLWRYSPFDGGFWTDDNLSFKKWPGRYSFEFPPTWFPPPKAKKASRSTTVRGTGSAVASWWRSRHYTEDPFAALRAESIDAKTPRDALASSDDQSRYLLDDIMARGDSKPVLVCGPDGAGKTFYQQMAAQQYELERRGLPFKIGYHDMASDGIRAGPGWPSNQLALFVYRRLAALGGEEVLAEASSLDTPQLLARCGAVAKRFLGPTGFDKLYVLWDGLDALYDSFAATDRPVLGNCLADLVRQLASGAADEAMAFRLFLPADLCDALRTKLGGSIRRHALPLTATVCKGVIRQRLAVYWDDRGPAPVEPLGALLDNESGQILDQFFSLQESSGNLTPRLALETMAAVAALAHKRGVGTKQIPVEICRRAIEDFRLSLGTP